MRLPSTGRDPQGPSADDSPHARFEALLARHRGAVLKVASIYCRDAEDRRDLAQEICTQLWQAYPRYDEGRSFSTWMYRVALNVAISHRRSSMRRDRYFFVDGRRRSGGDTRSGSARARRTGAQALPRHPAPGRSRSRPGPASSRGRNYRESAEVLGITETNVATKLNRLKHRLRRELADSRPDVVESNGTR
jgi:RNA polymerase sigma-70 factor, ECF subfamily